MQALPADIITPAEAGTIPGLFNNRITKTPEAEAYRFYDTLNAVWMGNTWSDIAKEVERWQKALAAEKLEPGDRVAIMARNSCFWVKFDQAALALGLVVVPIYTDDRANNVYYIIKHSGAKFLLIGGPQQWQRICPVLKEIRTLKRIVTIANTVSPHDKRLLNLEEWISNQNQEVTRPILSPGDLATIVYTSGTTGRPKGVMLSHRNILSDVYSCAQTKLATNSEIFLSFLPLSHMFERTVGYYLPMMIGATVAHSRGIQDLPEDLLMVKPTGLISVPRIFERVYAKLMENLEQQSIISRATFKLAVHIGWNRFEYMQGRASPGQLLFLWPLMKKLVADKLMAKFGGNLKVAISGGAALSSDISRVFVGLGIPVFQGYGLTETSPVVSVNIQSKHIPASIGPPLTGVEVKIDWNDELMVRGDIVMMGYWQNNEATDEVMDRDGWLHTGDKAKIEDGCLFVTGRIKDIIVLSTGEKVSPVDMEICISSDTLFDQVMVIGESRPYLTALVVLHEQHWERFTDSEDLSNQDINSEIVKEKLLERVAECLHDFPGYAQVYKITCFTESWTVDNDLLTSTLKMRRSRIQAKYSKEIEAMYGGYSI